MQALKQEKNEYEDWIRDYYKSPKGKWAKLDETKLLYVTEESRLFLQALWDAYGRLTQKASIILGIVTGLIGFIFFEVMLENDYLLYLRWYDVLFLGIYFIFLIITFFRLLKYQLPIKSNTVGTQPKGLFKKDVMNLELEVILVKQLRLDQKNMEYNLKQNTELVKVLKSSYNLVVLFPVVIITLYSLFYSLFFIFLKILSIIN